MNMLLKLAYSLLLSIIATQLHAATYRVTYTVTWNSADVSSGHPTSAHFSDLVGATHTVGSAFWYPGATATLGVERVAEIGNSFQLFSETQSAILSGIAGSYIQLAPNSIPGSSSTVFHIYQDKPEVSLISMIAPSPDWFVGVYGLSLYNEDGWIDSLSVDLIPWDAGTEDGNTFSTSNSASNPYGVIAIPANSPFIGSPVIAQLLFERIDNRYDVNEDGEVNVSDLLLLQREILNLTND